MRTSNLENVDERIRLQTHFNNFITAILPQADIPENIEHPSVAVFHDHHVDMANLVSCLQIHQCRDTYCKKNGSCRFGYPKILNESGKFEKKDGDWIFLPKRNHQRVVPYCQKVLKSWRCNMDITVVSSTTVLVSYITKYVTKSNQADLMTTMYFNFYSKYETNIFLSFEILFILKSFKINFINSCFLKFIFYRSSVLEKAREDENSSVFKLVSQILQKNCSGKLISIQEVFFRLMSEEYFMMSRTFIRIDVSSHNLHCDGSTNAKKYITAYFKRHQSLKDIFIFNFSKKVLFLNVY